MLPDDGPAAERAIAHRIGRLDQIAGIAPIRFTDGRARGVRAFDVRSGGGLRFTAVADRALDVSALECDGVPLVWHGPGGVAAPTYYRESDDGFARDFFGGLFTTCGLGNFGPGGSDGFGTFGMHGRINHLPAEDVCARAVRENGATTFEIAGTVREARLFGEDLALERSLRIEMGSRRLRLRDVVVNEGATRRPHMLLYHCNVGFPLLDTGSRLHVSHRAFRPRDARAAEGMADWDRAGEPDPRFAEQVFVHEPRAGADGRARALVVNRALDDGRGMALVVRFDPSQLCALFTWRMLGVHAYVMGIEPANCPTIEGRVAAAADGTLPFLEAHERRTYDLEFEVLRGAVAIDREVRDAEA